jgi:exodeoxyribonuclease-5
MTDETQATPEPDDAAYKVTLTEAQEKAVEVARQLYKDAENLKTSVGRLTGFAGTGKTTVIRSIAKMLGGILLLAPTGKAAVRATELSKIAAQTIHKWLYYPKDEIPDEVKDLNGKVITLPKAKLSWIMKPPDAIVVPPSRLIVIDEASMLTSRLWKDVRQVSQLFGCSVLLVGDPGQLPPISEGGEDFSPLEDIPVDYEIHLTEVVRQALDSPILLASKLIREGMIDQALKCFPMYPTGMIAEVAEWLSDNGCTTIVHRNVTRHRINTAVRARKKYEREAVDGEPLLILKNCYDLNIFNGEVIPFGGWRRRTKKPIDISCFITKKKQASHFGLANIVGEKAYLADEGLLGSMDGFGDKAFLYAINAIGKSMEVHKPDAFPMVRANFGYAITCHKSQGSEWPKVMVVLENSLALGGYEGRTWLYTAVTRAKEHVVLARI